MVKIIKLKTEEETLSKAIAFLEKYKSVKGYKIEGSSITEIIVSDTISSSTLDKIKKTLMEMQGSTG